MGKGWSCVMCLPRKNDRSACKTYDPNAPPGSNHPTMTNFESLVVENLGHSYYSTKVTPKTADQSPAQHNQAATGQPEYVIENETLVLNPSREDMRWDVNPLSHKLLLRSVKSRFNQDADVCKADEVHSRMAKGEEHRHELPYIPPKPRLEFLDDESSSEALERFFNEEDRTKKALAMNMSVNPLTRNATVCSVPSFQVQHVADSVLPLEDIEEESSPSGESQVDVAEAPAKGIESKAGE